MRPSRRKPGKKRLAHLEKSIHMPAKDALRIMEREVMTLLPGINRYDLLAS